MVIFFFALFFNSSLLIIVNNRCIIAFPFFSRTIIRFYHLPLERTGFQLAP